MKVILKESYANLGEAGDVVNVKPGYARNFLIPQKLALTATAANLKVFQDKVKEIDAKKQKAESATSTKKEDFSPVSIGEIRTKFNNSQETAKKIKDILSKKATLVNKFDSSDIEKVEWDTDTKSYKVTLDVDGWDNGSNNIVFLSVNELNSALGEDSTSSPEDDPLGIK